MPCGCKGHPRPSLDLRRLEISWTANFEQNAVWLVYTCWQLCDAAWRGFTLQLNAELHMHMYPHSPSAIAAATAIAICIYDATHCHTPHICVYIYLYIIGSRKHVCISKYRLTEWFSMCENPVFVLGTHVPFRTHSKRESMFNLVGEPFDVLCIDQRCL